MFFHLHINAETHNETAACWAMWWCSGLLRNSPVDHGSDPADDQINVFELSFDGRFSHKLLVGKSFCGCTFYMCKGRKVQRGEGGGVQINC